MTHQPRALSVPEERRLCAGLVVQPFVAGGLAFLIFPFFLLDANGRTLAGALPADVMDAAQSVAIGVGIVAFFVTLLGVWPAAVWLTKRRPVSFGEAQLWGLGFGNLPMIIGTMLAGMHRGEGFARGVAFASVLGLAGAAMFWIIALRTRLDRKPVAG
jgi:hypothetical protein